MEIRHQIYCKQCNDWLTCYQVWLPDGANGRVSCLVCNNTVGYTWDNEYKEVFPEWTIDDE
jgi:hypothetical protein